jgi:hypothetical protein
VPAGRPALAAGIVTLVAVAVAGCGDTVGLRRAGATPTAISPAELWPDLRPASSPAWPYDEASTETVRGVTVPGDDIHEVDPVQARDQALNRLRGSEDVYGDSLWSLLADGTWAWGAARYIDNLGEAPRWC